MTPANEQEGAQVADLAADLQAITGDAVEVAYVDQGYAGAGPATDAAAQGIQLDVVSLPEAKRGFILLPRRWVVERSFTWLTRFRRLARDYECSRDTLRSLHFLAVASILLTKVVHAAMSP